MSSWNHSPDSGISGFVWIAPYLSPGTCFHMPAQSKFSIIQPSHACFNSEMHLIVGFCILLRVYSLILFLKPQYATNVFRARFYCALLTTCFDPDRWPSSGKMYPKYIKTTTVYVYLCIWLTWLWHLPLYSWRNGSVDIHSGRLNIFCVHFTWR
jgi:hypothetical protein